ncbi:MAG: peroxiredoxin [Woeseia sp.]
MTAPQLNRVVSDFKCAATGDQTFQLKAQRGKHVIVYFYPKDATPGCTTEGQAFRDLYPKFKRQNAIVVGVSRDSLASHEKFKAKHKFPFDLLADEDETVCRKFDVIKEKNLYGRKHMGIERSTFLIDENGKLRAEWRKVAVKGHAEAVLDTLKNL